MNQNQQWTPQQPPQGAGGSGNGLMYVLIILVAVLALVLGAVAVLALGVGSDDSSNEAAVQTAPSPAAGEQMRPAPTAGAPARETVTETAVERDSGDSRSTSGSRIWGPDAGLEYCGNGGVTGSSSTSCPFAKNVADAVWKENIGDRHLTVRAYSPTTKKSYTMNCTLGSMNGRDATYKCTGGNNAVVYVGVAG